MKACLFAIRTFGIAAVLLACSGNVLAQACFTADDMDAATRSALQAAATRYFDMASRGDAASLKQNSIPAVANDFAGIENTIKENQPNFSGAHATARPPFLLKAEGTAPLPKAEFFRRFRRAWTDKEQRRVCHSQSSAGKLRRRYTRRFRTECSLHSFVCPAAAGNGLENRGLLPQA